MGPGMKKKPKEKMSKQYANGLLRSYGEQVGGKPRLAIFLENLSILKIYTSYLKARECLKIDSHFSDCAILFGNKDRKGNCLIIDPLILFSHNLSNGEGRP
jgi:hypothetical protein